MEKSMLYKTARIHLMGSIFLGSTLFATHAPAQNCPAPSNGNIFNLSLCIEGDIAKSVGSSSIQDILDQIDEDRLDSRFPNYINGVSAGEYRLDLRGLPVTLSYAHGSAELIFNVPSLGITRNLPWCHTQRQ